MASARVRGAPNSPTEPLSVAILIANYILTSLLTDI